MTTVIPHKDSTSPPGNQVAFDEFDALEKQHAYERLSEFRSKPELIAWMLEKKSSTTQSSIVDYWVLAAQKGDESAQNALIKIYDWLVYYKEEKELRKKLGRWGYDIVELAVEEPKNLTWRKVFDALQTYSLSKKFAAWLSTIASNTAKDVAGAELKKLTGISTKQYKKSQEEGKPLERKLIHGDEAMNELESLIDEDVEHDPLKSSIKNSVEKIIRRLVNKLSPRQKEAVSLKYYYGLETHEIAKKMNISPITVRNTLNDAELNIKKDPALKGLVF